MLARVSHPCLNTFYWCYIIRFNTPTWCPLDQLEWINCLRYLWITFNLPINKLNYKVVTPSLCDLALLRQLALNFFPSMRRWNLCCAVLCYLKFALLHYIMPCSVKLTATCNSLFVALLHSRRYALASLTLVLLCKRILCL